MRSPAQLKGRRPDATSLQEVRALIGEGPHRRDLLIEHLHKINDAWRGLYERHLVALAREMNLAMAEVYEVASFYHHFEILRDGEAAPAVTVRVCESLSCAMAGSAGVIDRVKGLVGSEVRVVAAPCIGRCEQAPAALVGQAAVPSATPEAIAAMCHPSAGGGSGDRR